MTEESSNDTITTNENDVVSGRGSGANRHKGNLVFRQLIKKNKAYYLSLGKNLKMGVARAIFDEIASKEPSGRFLQKNPETDKWFEVKRERALEKISQALREKPSTKKAEHPSGPIPVMESQQNVNYAPQDAAMTHQSLQSQRVNSYHQHQQPMGFSALGGDSSSRMMEQRQARNQEYTNFRSQVHEGMRVRGSHLGVSPMEMYQMDQDSRMKRMQMMDMNIQQKVPGHAYAPYQQLHPSFGTGSLSMAFPSQTSRMSGSMMRMPNQQGWVDMAPMPAIPDVPQEFLRGHQRMASVPPDTVLRHTIHSPKDPFVRVIDRQYQHQSMMAIPATPLQSSRGRSKQNMDPFNTTNDVAKRSEKSPETFIVVQPKKRGHFSSSHASPDEETIDSFKRRRTSNTASPKEGSSTGIMVDTDLDCLKNTEDSMPKLVSPQHEDDKSLPPLEENSSSRLKRETEGDKETDQTGLATLSTAASLMSKQ